jgi:hypothetical protein
MPQFNKGDTFSDGQQVTGTRLNNLIDGATLLVGAIADQPSLTANTLESTDGLIVNDAGALKKATIGDILNSELDAKLDVATIATLKSGHVEGVLGSDVNLIPLDGTTVTGKTFTSVDGITAIVTSVAHGLVTNMLLTFTASNAVYNGTYLITVLTVDTFSYVITQTTPVAASGTLSYVKQGSVNVDGNVYVSDKLNVVGQTNLNTLNVSGAIVASGAVNVTGGLSTNGIPVQKNVGIALLSRRLTRGTQHFISPALAWVDLPYNTITQINPFVVNAASFTGVLSSTGSSVITLPAGTYVFEAEASQQSGGGGSDIVIRLLNNTTSTTIEFGRQTTLAGYVNSHSHLYSIFTVSVETQVKVQMWVTTVAHTNNPLTGLSVPAPSEEVVFTAKIMKFV